MSRCKKNPFSKRVEQNEPYAIYTAKGWTWKVLKTYHRPDKEDAYARWFVAVSSPFTGGIWELGDAYMTDITTVGQLSSCTFDWQEYYGN